MTHHHQTNGASLEDCHTNFFALTELCGIKWRKLVWGEGGCGREDGDGGAPLEDPVISSYARCLAGDILCVWRRVAAPPPPNADPYDMAVPPPPPPPPLSLRAAKELWIFWYGEEPDLSGLVAPELISCQSEQGSWESGLSYECRSLLFKALHNLIERCLLSRDFVRLGKWFVQPYDGDEEDVGKSPWHLSFSFAFFVHGESTVCAIVDVRQHPPVRTLTPQRLAHAARRLPAPADHHNNKVILAPFGLEGELTGAAWSESEPATARLLHAWRQLYPLVQSTGAVEVISGGVKLRYPTAYVLLTEMEPLQPSPAPLHHPLSSHRPRTHASSMAERALACGTVFTQPTELCNGHLSPDKIDVDFVDPTRKTTCTCSKRRGARAGRPARRLPFHQRAHTHTAFQSAGVCSPGSCGGGSPVAPTSAPPSAGPTPVSPSHLTAAAHQLGGTLHTPAPTPETHAPPTPAPPSTRQHYTQASPAESKVNGVSGSASVFGCAGGGGAEAGGGISEELLKPPVLAAQEKQQDPVDDEHTLHMLYDYTCVRAWLEHPVKRFKTEESGFREELTQARGFGTNTELYCGHDHLEMASVPERTGSLYAVKRENNEDARECKNLYTLDGICPTVLPPDQLFDNDDASGDEALQIQTPPDSNKSGGEESRTTTNGSGGRCVRVEELSKMFPTPPSMEAHTQASPGAFNLTDDPSHTNTLVVTRTHALSPSPDPIEDWSYVFKPPTMYKYVGSSKYAPLTTLPSQLLPPVSLPANATYRPHWQVEKETASCGGGGGGVKRCASPLPAVHSAGTISAPASVGCPGSAGAISQSIGASPALRPPPPYSGFPPSPASPPASPRAQACPLLLNVLLADTVLNIFRDHNFDSCTLCVCNASPKVVGNIRGADCNTYLTGGAPASPGESPPSSPQPYDDDPIRCSCGFSAIVNRRLAHRAGLFYEDEMEITGLAEDPAARTNGRGLTGVTELVLSQCAGLGGPASALARAAHEAASSQTIEENRLNLLEYTDGAEAASLALRAAAGTSPTTPSTVHRWPFIGARGPRSSRDVVRLMRRLRPMLQDAIQKRCCGARMWDGVSGPLTWRQFHRLAGRGTEDLSEPRPVPPLLVGHDRDWLSISPYALRHWERLAIEPYSYPRDVAYVVLAPEGEALTEPLRMFFKELSTVYESCRLGRHAPLWRIARDGVVRASVTPDRDAPPRDDWVGDVPPGRLGECIRAYAETLRTVLVPQLANVVLDRWLLEPEGAGKGTVNVERPQPSPMRPPSTPDHPPTPNSQSDQESESGCNSSASGGAANLATGTSGPSPAWEEDDEGSAPALVLYVVEPPRAHAHSAHALHALLRLASRASQHLHHHNITVKIISLESVWTQSGCSHGEVRALALSVFACARRVLTHAPHIKSLTGFGTAAQAQLLFNSKDEKNRAPYRLYSPVYVLAPAKAIKDVADSFGKPSVADQCSVLYLSYCLSQDQTALLAVATDARGELLESAVINVHVPGRARRRRAAPARRLGLTKLMDFILGVMSQSAVPWRLVVGRIGRIGHGELKGWSWLLSRKNLVRASGVLREMCNGCSLHYPPGHSTVPCILSACLVSTEPDSCLRLMADRFTPDERFSVASHLHTPRDVTATHILVFPTSATTTSSHTEFQEQHINGNENDDLFPVLPENEDMTEGMDGLDNMNDLFSNEMFNMWSTNSPTGAAEAGEGAGSRDGSPGRGAQGRQQHSDNGQSDDPAAASEQVGTVLQQPLALGYLVSTAPLGAMPAWWWANCDHLRDACPAFLKNALHLQSSDDMLLPAAQRAHDSSRHPLDSHVTTDVLRYVLEGYNALSWLALDGNTHDRLSCLPLHVQVLMQLYHTALALS